MPQLSGLLAVWWEGPHSKSQAKVRWLTQVRTWRGQRAPFPFGRERPRCPSPKSTLSLSPRAPLPGVPPTWCRFCVIWHCAPSLLPRHLAAVLWNFLSGSPTWGEQHTQTCFYPSSWTPLLVQGNIPLPQVTSEIVGSALDVTANSETPSCWYFCPHFAEEESKAQRSEVTCLSSHRV